MLSFKEHVNSMQAWELNQRKNSEIGGGGGGGGGMLPLTQQPGEGPHTSND